MSIGALSRERSSSGATAAEPPPLPPNGSLRSHAVTPSANAPAAAAPRNRFMTLSSAGTESRWWGHRLCDRHRAGERHPRPGPIGLFSPLGEELLVPSPPCGGG